MELQLTSNYTHQGLTHAINIFNFPQDYSNNPKMRTRAFTYLLQHRNKNPEICPRLPQIVNQMLEMFEEIIRGNINRDQLSEIADILLTYSPEHGRALINRVRELREPRERYTQNRVPTRRIERINPERAPIRDRAPIRVRTITDPVVYSDSQNVHNTKINKSVLHATKTLYNMYKEIIQDDDKDELISSISNTLCAKYLDKTELVRESIKYIKENVATFTIEISLKDTFKALWLWILEQDEIDELEKRLLEELEEMEGECSTGHLSRLINVMQGHTTNEDLCVRITNFDQCKAVITSYLTKKLSECTDEKVIEGITDGNKEYIDYITDCVAKKLLEWKKDYGDDFLDNISNIVNGFAGYIVFSPES